MLLWIRFQSDELIDPNHPTGVARENNRSRLFKEALFKREPPVGADQVKGGTTRTVNVALKLPYCKIGTTSTLRTTSESQPSEIL